MHRFALVLLVSLPGCGLVIDYAPPDPDAGGAIDAQPSIDGGTSDAGARDGGPPPIDPCAGVQEGGPCTLPDEPPFDLLCLGGRCVESRCGDGVLDPRTEACDDGNAFDGDGCRRDCTRTCEDDAGCPTADGPCQLPSACVGFRCELRSEPDGTSCVTRDDRNGECRGGRCAPPACGNGVLDPGEDCDQGADSSVDDGCTPDCKFSCHGDSDCDDGVFCTGVERCAPNGVGHACTREGLVCPAPSDGCGAPFCDSSSDRCDVSPFDRDGDGFGAGSCGGDCDDGDPSVSPGSSERCNGRDDDCDGAIDDGLPTMRCFRDRDRDGFGDGATRVERCMCHADEVTIGGDCFDSDDAAAGDVHPGQSMFFGAPYSGAASGSPRFDYNCDGRAEQEHPASTNTGSTLACGPVDGDVCNAFPVWQGDTPQCGRTGTLTRCVRGSFGCMRQSLPGVTQRCR